MKKCSKCKKILPLNDFYRKSSSDSSPRHICKSCKNIESALYIKKNREKLKKLSKQKYDKINDRYGLGVGTIRRYGFKLALEVYERAERKCDVCGEKNDLTIHHKDRKGRNYERIGLPANNNINNLQVLCRKCHGSIHGKQGKGIKKQIIPRREVI